MADAAVYGLRDLGRVPLEAEMENALERLRAEAIGMAAWRARMHKEARELFGLERISGGRMRILTLECRTELHAVVRLDVVAPTQPPGARDPVLHSGADLGLRYPEAILERPLPGTALVNVLAPRWLFHPNVSWDPVQALCLGVSVPRGYPLREAVLAAYAALSLQNVTVDERSPEGVLNAEAARFWGSNMDRMPLSTAPFLDRTHPEVRA